MDLILGAGLAGLSAARILTASGRPYRILEREAEIGGLCRSIRRDGFVFDLTGHLLHLRTDRVREALDPLIREKCTPIDRKSFVYSKGVFTDFPFQANTHGLPPEVIRDCLLGFLAVHGKAPGKDADLSFRQWILKVFGSGIAEHFMIPFNEKLWCADLETLSSEWVSWSIPQPTLEEVVNGAVGIPNRRLGYNSRFFYPRNAGIDHLPKFLARPVDQISLDTTVTGVDLDRRVVTTGDGSRFEYRNLINTLPLGKFLEMSRGLPEEFREVRKGFRSVQVINLNLGIERESIFSGHWIYFPEKQIPFYRVGFPANFTDRAVPRGCSSLYIEFSRPSGAGFDRQEMLDTARRALEATGILRSDDRICLVEWVHIDPAYVLHDPFRRERLPRIFKFLERQGVLSAGRFGTWGYGSMEDAIREGTEASEKICAPVAAGVRA